MLTGVDPAVPGGERRGETAVVFDAKLGKAYVVGVEIQRPHRWAPPKDRFVAGYVDMLDGEPLTMLDLELRASVEASK